MLPKIKRKKRKKKTRTGIKRFNVKPLDPLAERVKKLQNRLENIDKESPYQDPKNQEGHKAHVFIIQSRVFLAKAEQGTVTMEERIKMHRLAEKFPDLKE